MSVAARSNGGGSMDERRMGEGPVGTTGSAGTSFVVEAAHRAAENPVGLQAAGDPALGTGVVHRGTRGSGNGSDGWKPT